MLLWRVSTHAAFDGEGTRRFGGRWNSPGTAIAYTSGVLALAVLELLAHASPRRIPTELVAHYADLPDDLPVPAIAAADLPTNWRDHPAPLALRELGDRWARERSSVALAVPAAVLAISPELIALERNFLLNPSHPDFARIHVQRERFPVDPRLWRFG